MKNVLSNLINTHTHISLAYHQHPHNKRHILRMYEIFVTGRICYQQLINCMLLQSYSNAFVLYVSMFGLPFGLKSVYYYLDQLKSAER